MLGTHCPRITIRKGDVTMTGAEFRTWRRSKEITQQEVADKVDCTKSAICRWEKGEFDFLPSVYERILIFYRSVAECD